MPITTPNGEIIDKYLLTNLNNNEFNLDNIKKLYHLRWNVETSYRVLKSNLKLENFSGLKPTIIIQDIYISVFAHNLAQDIIAQANLKHEIKQEKYKYKMKINNNYAIGAIKTYLIKIIVKKNNKKSDKMMGELFKNTAKKLVPIRDNRSYSRNINPVNKCRMSYKYSY